MPPKNGDVNIEELLSKIRTIATWEDIANFAEMTDFDAAVRACNNFIGEWDRLWNGKTVSLDAQEEFEEFGGILDLIAHWKWGKDWDDKSPIQALISLRQARAM